MNRNFVLSVFLCFTLLLGACAKPAVVIVSDRFVASRYSSTRDSPKHSGAKVLLSFYWVSPSGHLELLPLRGYDNLIQGPTGALRLKLEVKNKRHRHLVATKNVFYEDEPLEVLDVSLGNTDRSSHVFDLPYDRNGRYNVRISVVDEKTGREIASFENIKYTVNIY